MKDTKIISEANSFRLGYRGDIEGLRAVAVLLVIVTHAGVPWIRGGFIGVDVFFVLSGYLITGLLLQEIKETGEIKFLKFYARRLKRLLPALLFMVILTSFLAALLFAPLEQLSHVAAARTASVWFSNIYFAITNFGYFDKSVDENLFLHTWSLGVEEQFYLVWPVLIMFLLGAWKWQGVKQDLSRLFYGMIATIGLFLVFSVILSYTLPLWGFYSMPSRAWQFALGAIVLLWTTQKGKNISSISSLHISQKTSLVFSIGGWAGIVLILASAFILGPNKTYPGLWALMPSVGAALVLVAGSSDHSTSITKLLSVSPMQWVGRLSYSWYLWHWPMLILGSVIFINNENINNAFLIALSLGIALFSYKVVETPIRRSKYLSPRIRLTITASLILMLITFGLSFTWQNTANKWAASTEQKIYTDVRTKVPVIYKMGCDEWFYTARVRVCAFGEKSAKKTAILIGDSMMGQWFPAIAPIFTKPGWRLLVLTKSACPMVDEPFFYKRIGKVYAICDQWRGQALNVLASFKPDVVIMGGSASYEYTRTQWVNGTKSVLEKISPVAGEVYILRGTYILPFDGPACLARRAWQAKGISAAGDCSAPAGSELYDDIFEWLGEASADFDNVKVLDLNSLICPDGVCYAELNGEIVFRDSQHLSVDYTKTLTEKLEGLVLGANKPTK